MRLRAQSMTPTVLWYPFGGFVSFERNAVFGRRGPFGVIPHNNLFDRKSGDRRL